MIRCEEFVVVRPICDNTSRQFIRGGGGEGVNKEEDSEEGRGKGKEMRIR